MENVAKKVVVGSMAVAGLVAIAAVVDMIVGMPFSGRITMDIMFVIGAGLVIYMGWDSYDEMR